MRRPRGWIGLICIVALVAVAMAPVSAAAWMAVLVPLPALFGAIVSRRFVPPTAAPTPLAPVRRLLPPRAPPAPQNA